MHDARAVANEFIRRGIEAGNPLTPLQIQKLVYFSHARMLSIHRQPLIREPFEAWDYGPVVSILYQALKGSGSIPVTECIEAVPEVRHSLIESDIIDCTFRAYGGINAGQLISLTHMPGSPWADTDPGKPISNKAIEAYYAGALLPERSETINALLRNNVVQRQTEEGLEELLRGEIHELRSEETEPRLY